MDAPPALEIGRVAADLPPSFTGADENVTVGKDLLPRHIQR